MREILFKKSWVFIITIIVILNTCIVGCNVSEESVSDEVTEISNEYSDYISSPYMFIEVTRQFNFVVYYQEGTKVIYAALLRHPARKTAYIDGVANSIASVIAMAADEIVMHPGSSMGIHNMEVCCSGNAADLRKMADSLDKLMEGSRKIYLDRSGGKLTEEKLKELLDAETILTPKECMEYGFCDRIEERRREPPPAPDEGTAPKPQEEKTLEQILESWR